MGNQVSVSGRRGYVSAVSSSSFSSGVGGRHGGGVKLNVDNPEDPDLLEGKALLEEGTPASDQIADWDDLMWQIDEFLGPQEKQHILVMEENCKRHKCILAQGRFKRYCEHGKARELSLMARTLKALHLDKIFRLHGQRKGGMPANTWSLTDDDATYEGAKADVRSDAGSDRDGWTVYSAIKKAKAPKKPSTAGKKGRNDPPGWSSSKIPGMRYYRNIIEVEDDEDAEEELLNTAQSIIVGPLGEEGIYLPEIPKTPVSVTASKEENDEEDSSLKSDTTPGILGALLMSHQANLHHRSAKGAIVDQGEVDDGDDEDDDDDDEDVGKDLYEHLLAHHYSIVEVDSHVNSGLETLSEERTEDLQSDSDYTDHSELVEEVLTSDGVYHHFITV